MIFWTLGVAALLSVPLARSSAVEVPEHVFVHGVPKRRARDVCRKLADMFTCTSIYETGVFGTSKTSDIAKLESAFGEWFTGIAIGSETVLTMLGGTIHYQDRSRVEYPQSFAHARTISDLRRYSDDSEAPIHLSFLHERSRQMHNVADSEYVKPRRFIRTGADGSGVTVYAVGEMVSTSNVDFSTRLHPHRNVSTQACSFWYGTHSAALVIGRIHGVARASTLRPIELSAGCLEPMPLHVFLDGMQRVLDEHPRGQPAIVLASQVIEVSETPAAAIAILEDIVRALSSADIATVSLSGARGKDACLYSPQRMTEVITVGALTVSEVRGFSTMGAQQWEESNHGECVDIWAPGHGIASAGTEGYSSVAVVSGSMQAASITTGVAALVLQMHPDISPASLKHTLLSSALRIRDPSALALQIPERIYAP